MLASRLSALAWVAALAIAPMISSAAEESTTKRLPAEVIDAVKAKVDAELPALLTFYKALHGAPELSTLEVKTAARLAQELRDLGFTVTERVGGTGVVGVVKNGDGPTVLVRADMDALPVTEKTGLDYSSKVQVRDAAGALVGVMHACGHDMHMTCWVGVARTLVSLKSHWKGTLVFIGQPAEERGIGARAMIGDGLLTRFPKPDYALALHCEPFTAHGFIGYTSGLALANVDSVDIRVIGKGGHGAAPHTTIDPIVIAARIVMDLQTLVSREIDPLDSAVVTVGSIQGGTKHNIIPSEVRLQLTVRSFKDSTRKHLLEGIERIAKAAAAAARAPTPEIKLDTAEFTPALNNDPALTKRTVETLRGVLGKDKLVPLPPVMGGEDFSWFGRKGIPAFLFRLGTIDPERIDRASKGGAPLPSLHSDGYWPVPEPTIKTGVLAMTVAVLNLTRP